MKIKTRSRITVFILSSLVWFAFTGVKYIEEIIIGIILAALISLLAGHFLITSGRKKNSLKRVLSFIKYVFVFIWEMIKANLQVAYLVIHPNLPIKPGIVKIKTSLTEDIALTTLGNSITLTPGTLTLDVNKQKKELYIHWINVKAAGVEEASKEISAKFEKILTEVFE